MPIGTIIGWLIGQFAISLVVYFRHHSELQKTFIKEARERMIIVMLICKFTGWTAMYALIGTFIELLVR